jgi:hypothetical protein
VVAFERFCVAPLSGSRSRSVSTSARAPRAKDASFFERAGFR